MSQPEHNRDPTIAASPVTPVILCGGSGTRLWPLSTPDAPKPFLNLLGETSLFQETLSRCSVGGMGAPVIVTGRAHVEHVAEQSRGFDLAEIIVEPEAKQTAAAIALAAERLGDDAIMIVCPSDHHIADPRAFAAAVTSAAPLAAEGMLVCVTVTATSPESGYGYVCRGERLSSAGYRVAKFIEKPDRGTAAELIAGHGAAWNAGIFLLRAGSYLDELRRHRPAIARAVSDAVRDGRSQGSVFNPAPEPFSEIEPESIDFAVMENTDRAAMVEAQMGWSDIGNWQALHDARPKDSRGNSVHGPARLVDCRNLAIESDGPVITCMGVDDLVVVAVGDRILVTRRDLAPDVGKIASSGGD